MGDLFTAVTGVAAPEACRTVQNLIAVDIGVVHAVGGGQQAGCGFELPVRRKRHPEIVENGRVRFTDLIHDGHLLWDDNQISDFFISNKSFSF
ncbi:hypothetical protein GGD56_000663 [Rhizobium mongolense]|uniref:Uncharacterized protein n=1 Tax=Rhizobium mongolense TaxID=57676 RepID=A0ABR6IG47_9HYPH|nr:hypothetical protein [Rhizobium mongolense]